MNNSTNTTGNGTRLGDDGGGGGPGFVPILPLPIKIGFYVLYAIITITGKNEVFSVVCFSNRKIQNLLYSHA